MSGKSYSRFTIRRRILEVAMVLWVIAYFCGFFERPDQAATASATPAGPVSSGTAQSPHR